MGSGVYSSNKMEIGPLVVGISLVAIVYVFIAAFIVTRAMWRSFVNTPAAPLRLCISLDDSNIIALLKGA